jgi:hypothetical protein
MASRNDGRKATLAEIEQLLAAAHAEDRRVPEWVEQLAAELRAPLPEGLPVAAPPPGPDVADRIIAEPRLSLDAQANLDARALGALKR